MTKRVSYKFAHNKYLLTESPPEGRKCTSQLLFVLQSLIYGGPRPDGFTTGGYGGTVGGGKRRPKAVIRGFAAPAPTKASDLSHLP
jgi:hypothetical protein